MKIRTGFVSNSSSSSFVVVFKPLGLKNITLSLDEYFGSFGREEVEGFSKYITKVVEKDLLTEGFTIVIDEGRSGERANGLIRVDKKIANFIHQHNLFLNEDFVKSIKDFIIINKMIPYEDFYENVWSEVREHFSDDYTGDYENTYSGRFLKKIEELTEGLDGYYVDVNRDVDYDSIGIWNREKEEPIDEFIQYLKDWEVLPYDFNRNDPLPDTWIPMDE